MRLLLDESLPRLLGAELRGHEVATVQSQGWSGADNGELLHLAGGAGFQALITPDRGFEFQQDLSNLPVTIVVLHSPSNRFEDLVPLMGEVLRALDGASEHPCLLKVGV